MPNDLIDKSMQETLAKVQAEMPDVQRTNLSAMGPVSKLFAPRGAFATTNPFTKNIKYDAENMNSLNKDEKENTMAHELTHVRQAQNTPFMKRLIDAIMPSKLPYAQRGNEMEAFQTERDRSLKNHLSMPDPQTGATDIQLPSIRRR